MRLSAILPVALGCGCGSSAANSDDTMVLTSTAFAEGGTIPAENTCGGANTSPALTWSGTPSAAQSFAVVLLDRTIDPALIHWIIYDIPASATGLPAQVENTYDPANVAGAHQTLSIHAGVIGYYGPCPQVVDHYEIGVHALDVAALPDTTTSTSAPTVLATIMAHQLAQGRLSGTYGP
jgi:Raf kinase inhibitor-like YbhB/YbcL family protein